MASKEPHGLQQPFWDIVTNVFDIVYCRPVHYGTQGTANPRTTGVGGSKISVTGSQFVL